MKLIWTEEQNRVFDTVLATDDNGNPLHSLIKINAIAGASKTTTLVELAKRFNGTFRYLVFGNANAAEAKLKFGHNAICSTLHSLAYSAVVNPYGLKTPAVSFISWAKAAELTTVPYGHMKLVSNHVDSFCNSAHTSLDAYADEQELDSSLVQYIRSILEAMYTGVLSTTHSFYLKLYHIGILEGNIKPVEVDLLAVDEAGDLTQITLDIFDNYPAKQKVMVGDSGQAIFEFMKCVNGFDYYRNQGVLLNLTKSFRVSTKIAHSIQRFCNSTFDPTMVFEGMEYPISTPAVTEAYITRTNASLIAKMVELDTSGIPFKLVSKAKAGQLFKYPLCIMGHKPGSPVYDDDLRDLCSVIDKWHTVVKHIRNSGTYTGYLMDQCADNPSIISACKLINQFGYSAIWDAHALVDKHKHAVDVNLTLMTAHSSKGLERDIVTLDDDMNDSVEEIIDKVMDGKDLSPAELAELKLYYVAISRCKLALNNAKFVYNTSD